MDDQKKDLRWEQRFNNYKKALAQLQKFVDKGDLSDLEEQGLIKAFEYTFELAWNVLKDYLNFQGVSEIHGSRDAFRIAFNRELINQGERWMDMVEDRIQTVHSYDEDTARKIADAILDVYHPLFLGLKDTMDQLITDNNG